MKEHTKHQKYVSKKNAEVKQLLQEVSSKFCYKLVLR